MRTCNLTDRQRLLVTACLSILSVSYLGACAGNPGPPAAPSTTSTVTPSPAPPSGSGPATTPKPSQRAATATPGSCGTVTAASGRTLQVLESEAGGVDCATGKRLIERFHQKIAGKQPAESNEPISDAVDGWLCVSGPPAAQGGTTCSKDSQTVFAAVVPTE